MTDLQGSQGFALVFGDGEVAADVSQAFALAVINRPSQEVQVSLGKILTVYGRSGTDDNVQVFQAFALAVVRGLPEWPICRAWTYTLDGHDYYVLNTIDETLVCDLSNDPPTWHVWGSGESTLWRAWIGRQWTAKIPDEETLGSNVLVGDRAIGTLYFLNPELPADDKADFGSDGTQAFKRVITGQLIIRGRSSVPCFGVELTGSPPQLYDSTLNSAELFISDDRGASYVSCGSITVEEGAYDQRFDWLSLGSMASPGRLFQVVDYGALIRIDDLEMPDAPKS